jgi:hypothetical protein
VSDIDRQSINPQVQTLSVPCDRLLPLIFEHPNENVSS